MIELALIPPISLLPLNRARNLHMMLPAGLRNQHYARHYGYLCKCPDAYVILDNGMFESHSSVANPQLLQMAKDYDVDEIVLPDMRGDSTETLALQREFMHLYRAAYNLTDYPPKVMAVVQGKTKKECKEYIDQTHNFLPLRDIVFGLPRRLTEDIAADTRIDLCEFIMKEYGINHPVHLLGVSRAMTQDVRYLARNFPDLVRGIDTDAPFVWTAALKHLDLNETAERPPNYLNMSVKQFSPALLRHNTNTLERWCRGE